MTESAKTNFQSSEGAGTLNMGSLLSILESPEFVPTPALEKGVQEKFYKNLKLAIEDPSDVYFRRFGELLSYVLAIAEKDEKFVKLYFQEICSAELLLSLLRQDSLHKSHHTVFSMVLSLIHKIVLLIPSQSTIFATYGLHEILCSKIVNNRTKEYKIEDIITHLDILEVLTDKQKTLQNFSNVDFLNWIHYVLQCLIKDKNNVNFTDAALKAVALVSKITNNGPLNNSKHLKNFDDMLCTLEDILPDYKESFKEVKQQLKDATTIRRSFGASAASNVDPAREDKRRGFHQLRINQLILTSSTENSTMMRQKLNNIITSLIRFALIEKMDPETNEFLSVKNMNSIPMEMISEFICGMLNSNKGGNIHIGVNGSRRVEGIRMSFNDRDSFRSGIDHLFLNEISPLLLPNLVAVKFIPVLSEEDDQEIQQCSFYVIQIIIPANMNTLYFLKQKDRCFLRRKSSVNIQLSLKEVRHLAVTYTEKRFIGSQ